MARSKNSRKGRRGGRSHNGRHNCCGSNCEYCKRNFTGQSDRETLGHKAQLKEDL